MKIFLTGATGYIGSAVARTLAKHGHTLMALTRSAESETKLAALSDAIDFEFVRGDVLHPASIRRGAEKADGVIHAASPGNETYAAADNNVISTVIDTLAGSGRPFIYTSGIAVHGSTGGKTIDETAPYDPSPMVAFRVACERRVKAAAEEFRRCGSSRRAITESCATSVTAKTTGAPCTSMISLTCTCAA
jgi:nucleoside-diphosphate-sugar epimerase